MLEGIVGMLTFIMFIALIFLEACGILAVVKLGFIAIDFIDKITDKLKKKVRN